MADTRPKPSQYRWSRVTHSTLPGIALERQFAPGGISLDLNGRNRQLNVHCFLPD
jgi:hypothetical protein